MLAGFPFPHLCFLKQETAEGPQSHLQRRSLHRHNTWSSLKERYLVKGSGNPGKQQGESHMDALVDCFPEQALEEASFGRPAREPGSWDPVLWLGLSEQGPDSSDSQGPHLQTVG